MSIINLLNALVTPSPKVKKHKHKYELCLLKHNGLWWDVYLACECGVEKLLRLNDEELFQIMKNDKIPDRSKWWSKKELEDGGYL